MACWTYRKQHVERPLCEPVSLMLETWRDGDDLDGRHYTITVVITDKAGNITTATTEAVVPHDMRDK